MESAEKMLKELGVRAKKASRELNRLGVKRKNEGLEAVAKALILHQDKILAANEKDVKKAKENQMKESLVDRLSLTEERIEAMAEGLTQIVALEDPGWRGVGDEDITAWYADWTKEGATWCDWYYL